MRRVGALVAVIGLLVGGAAVAWGRLADDGGLGDPQNISRGPRGTVATVPPEPCPVRPADADPVVTGGGVLAWQAGIGGKPVATAAAGDGLVVLDRRGCLFAFDGAGAQRWVVQHVTTGPLRVAGEVVTVGPSAYRLDDGTSVPSGTVPPEALAPLNVLAPSLGGLALTVDGVSVREGPVGGSRGGLHATDARTAQPMWERDVLGGRVTAIPYKDLVLAISDGGVLYGIEVRTGAIRHRTVLGGSVFTLPVTFDDRVYVGGGGGKLFAVDADRGGVLWQTEGGGQLTASPAASSGRAYMAGGDGNMHAHDAASGRVLWTLTDVHPFGLAPVVTPSLVIAVTSGGGLYAIREA